LQIALQISHGIQELHQAGIIHRDLKPENILLFSESNNLLTCHILDGQIKYKICDFGISRLNSS